MLAVCFAELLTDEACGLQVPTDVKFNYFDAEGNMQDIQLEELTKGKKASAHAHAIDCSWHCISNTNII